MVRVVCNILLIACIVLGAIVTNRISITQIEYDEKMEEISYPIDLFGDEEFQEEIKEQLYEVLHCMMMDAEGDVDAELKIEGVNERLEGKYDYNILYTDGEGKQHEISNCDSTQISQDMIQMSYDGALQNNYYEKNWENVYVGKYSYRDEEEQRHSEDFEWLNLGELMQELASEYPSHCETIATELVDHLELYKASLQRFLCYLATEENVLRHTAVEKSTYYKIYGCYPNYSIIDAEEELDDYEYDEASGLYKDVDGYFYDPKKNTWCEEESLQYKEHCKDMAEKMESIQKELNKENVQETENNVYQLTKEEKENLRKNIKTSLQLGNYAENLGEMRAAKALQVSFSLATMLKSPNSYSINFGVKKDYVESRLEKYYATWEKEKAAIEKLDEQVETYVICFIIDAVCTGVLVLFLCYVCGRKADTDEVQLLFFDHWKIEILLLLGCVGFGGLLVGLNNYYGNIEVYIDRNQAWTIFNMAEIGLCLWMLVQIFFSLVRRIKAKILYKNSFLALLMGSVQGKVNQGTLDRKMIGIMVALLVVLGILDFVTIEATDNYDMGVVFWAQVIMIGIVLMIVVYINRTARKLSVIIEGVKKIRGGDLNYQIPTDGKENHLNHLAQDINSLSDGLERAVDDMLRSERLKTELISNVSHDIKTPLTSIITYVDLLKREELQPEKAKEYVEVLDQKSQRLKVLTDDLFEAAKASSGAMATEITRIDIGALVCQAAGEFSEKFENTELELKNSVQDNVWFVQADGRLAWRVIENLFANVTKYAQPNSRVYVDAEQKGQMIEIVVKNVSAYELNISAEELMERFTRGDKSRNTEGSGLGLNIAKSLAELQGGNFFVEIDGDLFKAILQLPMDK